jgi:hypothetical protein
VSRQPVPTGSARLIGCVDFILGAIMVVRPDRIAGATASSAVPPIAVVRVLGSRYLVQGLTELARPGPTVLALSSGVDGLHALSMFALAAARPEYRRPAMTSGTVATVRALVAGSVARRMHQTQS